MKTKDGSKKRVLIVWGLLTAGILTGCNGKNTEVIIKDGNTQTIVCVREGCTVAEALSEAEIMTCDKDKVSPEKDEVVKNTEEIIIKRYAKVRLIEGESVTEVEMTGKKVQDVLEEQSVALKEQDYLNYSPNAYLVDGMEITVIRRLAVTIQVDGEIRECLTKANTVADLLEEQNISLDRKDIVSPGKNANLTEGIQVKVERVSVKELVEKEKVPFETVVEYSDDMYSDETVEKTPGKEGEKEVTYQVTYVDGREDNRKSVKESIIKEPVSQVVVKGTKSRRRVVSKQKVEDCDGSGHGYYIITYSDGTVEYKDY